MSKPWWKEWDEAIERDTTDEDKARRKGWIDSGWPCLDPCHNHATEAEADACTAEADQFLRERKTR